LKVNHLNVGPRSGAALLAGLFSLAVLANLLIRYFRMRRMVAA
jgi:hypothetical protein